MIVIGLMSGTSMDGVDAALIETDGEYEIQFLAAASLSYDKDFSLDKTTEYHAKAIEKLLAKIGNIKIDLIGYHGQTTYHNPSEKVSIQVGDSQWLANHFNIPVVFDFRQNDLAHGGQGAPLAPLYHHARMIQKNLDNIAIINCGGIANVSLMKKNKITAGYDTGPGNVLLDRYVKEMTNHQYRYDKDGEFAKLGNIDVDFLEILFEKTIPNYYSKKPPKSLDIKDINYIDEIHQRFPKEGFYDGCATLAAFTAYTIYKSLSEIPENIILCGGGAKNPAIVNSLKYFMPNANIKTADEVGWSSTYVEAELIAWLAVRCIKNLPLTIPETTGVSKPVSGGKLFLPQSLK